MAKHQKRDTLKAALVAEVAGICRVSKRFVRMVISGDRENETVMRVYMELLEGKNLLLDAVKKLVPFD